MAMVVKSMPSDSSGHPKVMRSAPVSRSWPTVDSVRPRSTMATALMTEPRASTTAKMRPMTISEKYSAGPNSSATRVSGAASAAMTMVATEPAKKEPMAATPRAAPARPLRAIW